MPDDASEEYGGEAEETQAGPKSKMAPKTLILIGLPVILLQGALAYFFVSSYIGPHLPETKPRVEDKAAQGGQKSSAEVDLSEYVTFSVPDIIVNPAGTGGQRYLSVSVDIYVPEKLENDIAKLEPEIRGLIIERISRKRLDDLDDFKDQRILRGEIKDELNSIISRHFGTGKFKDLSIPRVIFSKYTIQ